MAQNHSMSEGRVAEVRAEFRDAVQKTGAAFGSHAFKRWVPEKDAWRQQVLASLFDAEIFAVRYFDRAVLEAHQQFLIEGLQSLFNDREFRQAVDAATNTPSSFRARIEMVRAMIEARLRG